LENLSTYLDEKMNRDHNKLPPLNYQEMKTISNLLSQRHADLLGDVVSKSVDDVSEEVHVQDSFAIPIVDVADLLNSCSVF
jgi:hypothetical protein